MASAPPPPGSLASNGSYPFPGETNFSVAAFTLTSPDVAVLLDHGPDALPNPIAVAKRVHRPKHIVTQVRKEQPGLVDFLFAEFLLCGEPRKDYIGESRYLRYLRFVGSITRASIKIEGDQND